MNEDEFFFKLTPERVLEAVEEGGFLPSGHCQALNSLENRVYDVRLESGVHVVAKFYRPGRWDRDQILEEHDFLAQLRENDIPVCAPLEFPGGETLRRVEHMHFALWPRTGGRAPDEMSDGELEILGRLIARIHNTGAAKPASRRLTLNTETYIDRPLNYLIDNDFIPPHFLGRYREAAERVRETYLERSRDVPLHRIHGDCHTGNLLNGREGWFFLDFDDFLTGPAVQDIWMLLPARDAEGLRRREVFLSAYRTFRDFESSWLRLIEPLRSMRFIHYAGWVARRIQDPAFPAAFPHFGTKEYWENETRDLEEQTRLFNREDVELHGAGAAGMAEPEEEELTNKDFFWDWEE